MFKPTNALKLARLLAITNKIDEGSSGAYIAIYGGVIPDVAGSPTTEVMLAKMPIAKPSLKTSTARSVTLNMPDISYALATGTPTWARMVSGNGTILLDMSVGLVDDPEATLVVNTLDFYLGGQITAGSLIFRE